MTRVPFSIALLDLIESVLPGSETDGLRLTSAALEVPIEVAVQVDDTGPTLLAHPRRWRLETVFDQRPGRVAVRLGRLGADGQVGGDD